MDLSHVPFPQVRLLRSKLRSTSIRSVLGRHGDRQEFLRAIRDLNRSRVSRQTTVGKGVAYVSRSFRRVVLEIRYAKRKRVLGIVYVLICRRRFHATAQEDGPNGERKYRGVLSHDRRTARVTSTSMFRLTKVQLLTAYHGARD